MKWKDISRIFSNFTPPSLSFPFSFVPTTHCLLSPLSLLLPLPPPIPDEKQSKSNLLAAGEGSSLHKHPEWIQHLPAVPGQPAVHQPWYPALREDVWGWLRQHRRTQHHQGRNKMWKRSKKFAVRSQWLLLENKSENNKCCDLKCLISNITTKITQFCSGSQLSSSQKKNLNTYWLDCN